MTPSSSSSNSKAVVLAKDWRRHGKARRKELLRLDKDQGGTAFVLNPRVSIRKYFVVGERVSFFFMSVRSWICYLNDTERMLFGMIHPP